MSYLEATTALIAPMSELAALRVIYVTGDAAEDAKELVTMLGAATGAGERVRRVLVLWAADCAERVLPLFEVRFPDDKRPRAAIEAAPPLDRGAARAAYAAARDAARAAADAADAAARAAADAAAYAADAARAARAARAAADAAADAAAYAADAARAARAARAAAYAAAYAAETTWQKKRLLYWVGKEINL